MAVDYDSVSPDFHEKLTKSKNPITSYYHNNRYQKIRKFLSSHYSEGMKLLDLGCGCSNWNSGKLPLTGLDSNKESLEYGKASGWIAETVCHDLGTLPLPFEEETFDFIILSEVLEHLPGPGRILEECRRILKRGGFLIITVPLDTFLSPWQVLFESKCFVLGGLLGDDYYKQRCGHIQHFSPESLSSILIKAGFSISEKEITLMNIGVLAKKSSP